MKMSNKSLASVRQQVQGIYLHFIVGLSSHFYAHIGAGLRGRPQGTLAQKKTNACGNPRLFFRIFCIRNILRNLFSVVFQIGKLGVFRQPCQLYGSDGTVSLFGYDDLRNTFYPANRDYNNHHGR